MFVSVHPQAVVLDTNVVLDCLVFRDPGCAPLRAALEAGALRWIATAPMRAELARVIGRIAAADPRRGRPDEAWLVWDRLCREVAEPAAGTSPRPRCTDPDDQIFVDLALAHAARWLLSHDRAVLKLARRLRDGGVEVATPSAWARHAAPG